MVKIQISVFPPKKEHCGNRELCKFIIKFCRFLFK